jgi:hypothetical protein
LSAARLPLKEIVMKKCAVSAWVLVAVTIAYAEQFEGVPGKTVLYNTTTRNVQIGWVGGGLSDMSIQVGGRVVHKFCGDKNEPVGIYLKYWKDAPDKHIGELNVCDGDVYAVTPEGIKTIKTVERPKKPAGEPDFSKPDEVIASLEKMKKEAQAKRVFLCVGKCNFAINIIKNLVEKKLSDPSIFKQRWQEANEEYQKLPK